MENMEEKEKEFLALVKAQYDKTGGANGLDLYGVNEILGISLEELRDIVQKLLKEKRITYLKPLNKWSITLPK